MYMVHEGEGRGWPCKVQKMYEKTKRELPKKLGIKEAFVKNPENHKKFILNNIYAHIYQLVKRAEDHIPSHVEILRYQIFLSLRISSCLLLSLLSFV